MTNKTIIKTVSIIGATILLILIGYGIWTLSQFRVVAVAPDPKNLPLGTSTLTIDLSQNLQEISIDKNISSSDSIINGMYLSKPSQITVQLGQLQENKSYTILLKDLRSTNGQVINEYVIQFSPTYVPFNELSSAEQKRQIEKTDQNVPNDPALSATPHTTEEYRLTSTQIAKNGKVEVELTLDILIPERQLSNPNDFIRAAKNDAFEYLKQNNVNPDNYKINYIPPEAEAVK